MKGISIEAINIIQKLISKGFDYTSSRDGHTYCFYCDGHCTYKPMHERDCIYIIAKEFITQYSTRPTS